MGTVIPLRRYQQKRQHRRVDLRQPVALVDSHGTVATAVTSDLSLGGMQVSCDRYTADSLHPSDRKLTPRSSVKIDAHLKLPLATSLVKLDVECRLIYLIEDSENDFLLGLQFARFHYAGAYVVERFLREAYALDQA